MEYRENRVDDLGPRTQGKLEGGNGGDDAANRPLHALVLLVHQHIDRAGFHYSSRTLRAPTARLRLGVETLVKLHDHSSAEQSSKLPRLSINKSQQQNQVRIIPAGDCEQYHQVCRVFNYIEQVIARLPNSGSIVHAHCIQRFNNSCLRHRNVHFESQKCNTQILAIRDDFCTFVLFILH